MRKRQQDSNDQRLTVFLTDGAVAGRVIRYSETGMEALMERDVPRNEWLRFTLHVPGGVVGGDLTCVGMEERYCRLQFAALTPHDRARLEPMMEPEE
jgi:hypothetical protein